MRPERPQPDPHETDLRALVCRHHWVIATPDGPTVEGSCRRCGLTRTFPSASALNDPVTPWDDFEAASWDAFGADPAFWPRTRWNLQ